MSIFRNYKFPILYAIHSLNRFCFSFFTHSCNNLILMWFSSFLHILLLYLYLVHVWVKSMLSAVLTNVYLQILVAHTMLISFSEEVRERLPPLVSALDRELILPISRLVMNKLLGRQTFAEYAAFMKQNTELSGDNCKFLMKAFQEIFYESTKTNLSEKDFLDSLQLIAIVEPGRDMYTVYEENRLQIRDSLTQGIAMTSYYDLRWRVEVQIARKVLLQEAIPKITLVLTLGKKSGVKNPDDKGIARLGDVTDLKDHILQLDPKTLLRITRILEGALSEAMSPYCKRIQKHIK